VTRWLAALALTSAGVARADSPERLLAATRHGSPDDRRAAARELATLGNAAKRAIAHAALSDDVVIRKTMADALAPDIVPPRLAGQVPSLSAVAHQLPILLAHPDDPRFFVPAPEQCAITGEERGRLRLECRGERCDGEIHRTAIAVVLAGPPRWQLVLHHYAQASDGSCGDFD
jgi:hypothetical protein